MTLMKILAYKCVYNIYNMYIHTHVLRVNINFDITAWGKISPLRKALFLKDLN